MDSDLCEYCNILLDEWGQCPHCWWWQGFDIEEEWDNGEDPFTDFGDYDERAYWAGEYDEEK
jgi:hypothetical protein